jgi:outer membrane protein assembly factor BamB
VFDGDFIYVLDQTGIMTCLNKRNGRVRWSRNIVKEYQAKPPHYGFSGSPIVAGDLILLTANTAGTALSKHAGEMVWGSAEPPEEGFDNTSSGVDYSSPVSHERGTKRFAVISGYYGLRSVDTETGKQLWAYEWGKSPQSIGNQVADLLVFDEKQFVVEYWSGRPGAFLLDIEGENPPKLLWENKETNSNNGSPMVIEGYIYVCQDGIQSGSGSLWCIAAKDGKVLWEDLLEWKPISLTAADGKLIVLDGEGRLYIAEASPHGFREISRCAIPAAKLSSNWWTAPVMSGGRIFCRSHSGDLVCIDLSG